MESLPTRFQRIVCLRGSDHARTLSRARRIRDEGAIPLMGDERWSVPAWRGLREKISELNRNRRVHPDAAWAALTSGTTNNSRMVLRSEHSWDVGARGLAELIDIGPGSVLLMPVHPVSSMAAFSVAWSRYGGFMLRIPETARLRSVDLVGATHLHGTPWQLGDALDILERWSPAERRANTLRWALIGGDRLDPQLRDRAGELGIRVAEYYGAAELSFVGIDLDGTGLRPFPGVQVALSHDHQLWVHTEQACLQVFGPGSNFRTAEDNWYSVGDQAEILGPDGEPIVPTAIERARQHPQAAVVVGRDRDSEERFPRSGDEVTIKLLGRADHAIMTAGATVIPSDVEMVLNRHPQVDAALVVGAPDERLGQLVTAYVVPDRGRGEASQQMVDTRALARHVAEYLPPASRPRAWRVVESLPMTGSGKVRRISYEEAENLPRYRGHGGQ